MGVSTRISVIGQDFTVLVNSAVSPKERSAILASFAKTKLAEGQQLNRQVFGFVPDHVAFVDGRRNAPINSVRAEGTVVFQFDILEEVFVWIAEQLARHSPYRTGRYTASHKFFADGVEVNPRGKVPPADRYVFLPTVPYSRKIERGLSPQAPDGVYEVVANMARGRFHNHAKIRFTYEAPLGSVPAGLKGKALSQAHKDARQPAIVIEVR